MPLKAGDVVFVEAQRWTLSRRAISAFTGGTPTVHAAIAAGDAFDVYESVTAGVRRER